MCTETVTRYCFQSRLLFLVKGVNKYKTHLLANDDFFSNFLLSGLLFHSLAAVQVSKLKKLFSFVTLLLNKLEYLSLVGFFMVVLIFVVRVCSTHNWSNAIRTFRAWHSVIYLYCSHFQYLIRSAIPQKGAAFVKL